MDAESDQIARAIRRLLRQSRNKPLGTCHPASIRLIQEDPALAAYFASVAEAGDTAWLEEVARVRLRQSERHRERSRRTGQTTVPPPELSHRAIVDLIPLWRIWGEMILAAAR